MMGKKQVTRPGFKITDSKGFHITLENGWTVSVQFGPGNYADNYDAGIGRDERASGERGSSTAECAIWGGDGEMVRYGDWGNAVSNRSTPTEVLELLNWAAQQAPKGSN